MKKISISHSVHAPTEKTCQAESVLEGKSVEHVQLHAQDLKALHEKHPVGNG